MIQGAMGMRWARAIVMMVALLFLTGAGQSSEPESRRRGIQGKPAPAWTGITSWHQLPGGAKTLDVASFKGKVVYLYFFQSWCPGCHSRGFPTLAETRSAFAGRDDVAFVVVQTVFEGFSTNTAAKGLTTLKKFALDIPMGHDPGPHGSGSLLMGRYRSGGTPWTVIIDKAGVVRFNGFHIPPARARSTIEGLLKTSL
jgi:thiol-disulfide isomerase/thioredoxin